MEDANIDGSGDNISKSKQDESFEGEGIPLTNEHLKSRLNTRRASSIEGEDELIGKSNLKSAKIWSPSLARGWVTSAETRKLMRFSFDFTETPVSEEKSNKDNGVLHLDANNTADTLFCENEKNLNIHRNKNQADAKLLSVTKPCTEQVVVA